MSAEDPYRWAAALVAEGLKRDQALQRMVAGGVDAALAAEILDSVDRNRPRLRPLRVAFGVLLMAVGLGAVLFMKAWLAAVMIVTGMFWVWDGARGKR